MDQLMDDERVTQVCFREPTWLHRALKLHAMHREEAVSRWYRAAALATLEQELLQDVEDGVRLPRALTDLLPDALHERLIAVAIGRLERRRGRVAA